ncbi:hypothetical protein [Devosia sp. RR2S18]|nr:hypothetical protein [Devosia sp. RR2S18]WIJ24046.1 hypothetical protein QOV41_13575 [Devosia sp. RR2S18]
MHIVDQEPLARPIALIRNNLLWCKLGDFTTARVSITLGRG